jgi:hypothetical protein
LSGEGLVSGVGKDFSFTHCCLRRARGGARGRGWLRWLSARDLPEDLLDIGGIALAVQISSLVGDRERSIEEHDTTER